MPKSRLVLLDANVVIGLFELKLWDLPIHNFVELFLSGEYSQSARKARFTRDDGMFGHNPEEPIGMTWGRAEPCF